MLSAYAIARSVNGGLTIDYIGILKANVLEVGHEIRMADEDVKSTSTTR